MFDYVYECYSMTWFALDRIDSKAEVMIYQATDHCWMSIGLALGLWAVLRCIFTRFVFLRAFLNGELKERAMAIVSLS